MISTIVCRGYGSFGGGVNELPTFGYTPGAAPLVTIYCPGMYRPASTDQASTYHARTESADTFHARVESTDSFHSKSCDQQI